MNVAESKRTRHLVLHVERGEELPVALIRALHDAEAKAATMTGVGIVEAIELASIDVRGQSVIHRIDTPTLIISMAGNVAVEDGATNVHLYATLARQTDLGHQTLSGHVRWARSSALDLFVTVFDDLVLERLTDDHGFSAALHATSRAPATSPLRVAVEESPREAAPPTPAPAPAPVVPAKPAAREPEPDHKPQPPAPAVITPAPAVITPAPAVAAAAPAPTAPAPTLAPGPALAPPARLQKQEDDSNELYPEMNDLVSHFSFGECEVVTSDGERIRLRQIKDGRVREVSLNMLRIEKPTTDEATTKRHFKLSRKN